MWETVLSLRALQTTAKGRRVSHHQPWIAEMRTKLDRECVLPLLAVVPPSGYIPDCLTPMVHDDETFAEAVEQVRQTPVDQWDEDLGRLGHGASHRDGEAAVSLRRRLHGADGLALVADAFVAYHRIAIAPHWERLRALALADIDWRTAQMAAGGVRAVLSDLHPRVTFTGDALDVTGYYTLRPSTGDGLLLVPSAFAWPEVFSLTAAQYPATLTYAPRGVGKLWTVPSTSALGAIERLLGVTRARILRQLDIPVTTAQVASAMEVSSSTANEHLKVLLGTGLVVSSRHGREVLYRRTATGDTLLQPR